MNDEKTLQQLVEELIPSEELKAISIMVQRMSIMVAFLTCGTTNKELLCNQVHTDKMGMIPMEAITEVYDDHMDDMMGTEFIQVEGELQIDPELLPTVVQYQTMLLEHTMPSEGATIN